MQIINNKLKCESNKIQIIIYAVQAYKLN